MPKVVLYNDEIADVLVAHLRAKMDWADDIPVHLRFITEMRADGGTTLRVESDMPGDMPGDMPEKTEPDDNPCDECIRNNGADCVSVPCCCWCHRGKYVGENLTGATRPTTTEKT